MSHLSSPEAYHQEQENQRPQRRYEADTDRLFLVYYSLPAGFNANKWGVSLTSIDRNIHTAVNKPVVVYRKNPNNPFHTKQAGAYIHPTPEEASSELGKITAQQYYEWQEKFAIGRVRSVDKRDKGYAFTLEITDSDAKQILKSDQYKDGIPGYTSPQILSNYGAYPEEERSNNFEHWSISHIALVDVPAYGTEQAGLRAKCLGAEKDCMITTRSASAENLGFCVKQATIDLINSFDSSQQSPDTSLSHTYMSQNENITSTSNTGSETVTFTGTNQSQSQQQQSNDTSQVKTEPSSQPQQEATNIQAPEKEREPEPETNLSPKEQQMTELIREQGKQIKNLTRELEAIKVERKQARLSFIIPRDLFKSDESHQKEVAKAMNENVPEAWLTEYWKTKRDLAMAQNSAKHLEQPMVARSASSLHNGHHDVPDFSGSQNQIQSSNVQKQLELQKRILEGGI